MRKKEVGFILAAFGERVMFLQASELTDAEKELQYKVMYLKYLRLLLDEVRGRSTTRSGTSSGHTDEEESIWSSTPHHKRTRPGLPGGIVL